MPYLPELDLNVQHEAGRAAYEDAKKQLNDINRNIETKTLSMENMQSELEKNKLDALENRKVEQACFLNIFFFIVLQFLFIFFPSLAMVRIFEASQECLKEQEALVPLEQAARQKVTELLSVMESEKSQGSVLKAIMQAKESNDIHGIYGRMGDLGAIDGEGFVYLVSIQYTFIFPWLKAKAL